jgi:endo-1,4-beta-xylanase
MKLLPGSLALSQVPLLQAHPVQASIGKAAEQKNVLFGVYVPDELLGRIRDQQYLNLVSEQAGLIAGEHGSSVTRIWRTRDKPDFREFDIELGFARQLGVPFFAWLFWNEHPPAWLKTESVENIRSFMARHLDAMMERYSGAPKYWQVVNESIWPEHKMPGGLRAGPYLSAMGEDYIPWAFKRVRAADPQARLILTEAHLERADHYGNMQRPAFLALLDRLLDKGTPIDAVALQGHILPYAGYSSDGVHEVIGRIAERKLGVVISEFDVDDRTFPDQVVERDRLVAEAGQRFLLDVFRIKKPELLISFGLSDKYSWIRALPAQQAFAPNRYPRPLPFDDTFKPKPLETSIRYCLQGLNSQPHAKTEGVR